jgi:Ser/Thr protein kinase RdoA (MazF antagonist)
VANSLWAAGRPQLIDFDDMGWAPPAYDLAVARLECLEHDGAETLWDELLAGYAEVRDLPPGVETHLDGLVAARHVFAALWLAGNLDQPSFAGAGRYIDEAIAELARIVR